MDQNMTILKKTPQEDIISEIIHEHFPNLPNTKLILELLKLFTQLDPIYIDKESNNILINKEKQLIVVNDLESTIQFFLNLNTEENVSNHNYCLLHNKQEYEDKLQELQQKNYKFYSLNLVTWQVFSRILTEDIFYNGHNLQFKAKYMPNFTMNSSIGHLNSVIASCLNNAKTIKELHGIFDISNSKLNKILLLSILTDIIDHNILFISYKNQKALLAKRNKTHIKKNLDVERAQKNGLFHRLLKKLAW